jgi:disulfide bond formation protein DsbB
MEDVRKHDNIPASERDRLSPVWDMSQERMFIENLLCQRFNYFLIFFSITIAGFSGAKSNYIGEAILIFGAIITTMFANVLRWNQRKLNFIIDDLHTDDSHPSTIIDKMAGTSRRKVIGIYIPTLCSVSIICASVINLLYLLLFK